MMIYYILNNLWDFVVFLKDDGAKGEQLAATSAELINVHDKYQIAVKDNEAISIGVKSLCKSFSSIEFLQLLQVLILELGIPASV